jgi:hypothetical protein
MSVVLHSQLVVGKRMPMPRALQLSYAGTKGSRCVRIHNHSDCRTPIPCARWYQ